MSKSVEQDTNTEPKLTEEQEQSVRELIGSAIKNDEAKGTGVRPFYRRPAFVVALAIILVATSVYGVRAYSYAAAHESTDDAFIDGHPVPIAPQAAGRIARVYVDDNQEVKKGELLFEIDPRDYQAQLANARAALQAAAAKRKSATITVGLTQTTSSAGVDQASSAVASASSGVQTAEAAVAAARGRLAQSEAQAVAAQAEATRTAADARRYAELFGAGVVSARDNDNAAAAAESAAAQLDASRKAVAAADAAVAQAEAQVAVSRAHVGEVRGQLAAANAAPQQVDLSRSDVDAADAAIAAAQASVRQAELNLSYTKIYAPADGRITKKAVETGALVQVGQNLMTLVPDQLWVTANFKETQLAEMRPDQPVEIRVDAYPDLVLRGHVDSIQSGSGAAFSLLPPENATGNYVKVVQRVPVKIVFDEEPDAGHLIGPGMSVVPEVAIR